MPTCWVNVATTPGCYENPQPEFLIAARASEFDLPFVCANKFGMETAKVGYCGRSLIADRAGHILCEGPGAGETILVDDVELGAECAYAEPLWGDLLAVADARRSEPRGTAPARVAVVSSAGDAVEADLVMAAAGAGADDRAVTPADAGTLTPRDVGLVGCLAGDEVARFAPARLQALQGMDILCAFDAPDDMPLLRTRAVENRCFVMASCRGGQVRVIAPDGTVLADTPGAAAVEITPSAAAVKTVAPGTDIWEQRRVSAYRN